MPQQINSNSNLFRLVESDVFSGSTNDGTASGTASANIERNPDIGSAADVAATDATGSKTVVSLLKGAFNKIPAVATIETLLTAIRDRLPSSLVGGKLPVDVTFPGTQPVSGSISVSNLPTTQAISGSVSVGNFPATQAVSGSISVSNFPATQPVSGSISVSNFPASQSVSGSVSVSNFPATQPVSLSTIPLAVDAATETTLSAINGKFASLGQKTTSGSVPVTLPSDLIFLPSRLVGGSGTALDIGSGTVSANTLRTVLASDGPTVTTLTNLLNATTLATPATVPLTFTIASGATLSDYFQLVGRAWLIFVPAVSGSTSIRVRVKKTAGDATGDLMYDDSGSLHELLLGSSSSTAKVFSSQATAFLSAAIGSNIAFEFDTAQSPAAATTIVLKAVV